MARANVHSAALKAEHFAVKIRGSGDVGVDHLETGALAVAIEGSRQREVIRQSGQSGR